MYCFSIKTNMQKLQLWRSSSLILKEMFQGIRNCSTKSDGAVVLRKFKPIIVKRIEETAKDHPVNPKLPVAREVLLAQRALYDGVSTLIQHIPVWACRRRRCTEVYISEGGHQIQNCRGDRQHDWVKGSINDILIPVEALHLRKRFQNVERSNHERITAVTEPCLHVERSNHERITAVTELCVQAGVDPNDQIVSSSVITQDKEENTASVPESLSDDDLTRIASRTLMAWETVRSGVHHLLQAYPVRVCKRCWEVHVGPWGCGHRAQTCSVRRVAHSWKYARVDDLVPQRIVWCKRRHDPAVLVDEGCDYYGHAPVVVDLCSKGGAIVPRNYFNIMKIDGLTFSL